MTERSSLSRIYQQATARPEDGFTAESVIGLLEGKHQGNGHASAVESLAANPHATVAYRLARALRDDAQGLAQALQEALNPAEVVKLRSGSASRLRIRTWAGALAAGLMGVAVLAGLWQRQGQSSGAPAPELPRMVANDVISDLSYEADMAMAVQVPARAAAATPQEQIFVDEFGGG